MTDLKLDSDEDHPRRLVVFPDGQLVAYGGDDGSLTCIDTTTSSGNVSVRTIHQYDEAAVRAVAVSSDGQRVAVGFDNGSTRLYQYDEYDSTDKTKPHPFVPHKKSSNNNDDGDNDNNDDEDDFGGSAFLSQPDFGSDDNDEDDREDRSWAGPPFEHPIRDLKFLGNTHMLAIASESALCVVNVTSAETMVDRYLQTQAGHEHAGCGIRGVSISSARLNLLASLAMDGHLCVFQSSGLDQLSSPNDKVPVYRDDNKCVPLNDIGEGNNADPSDRSCLPFWVQPNVLALPGKAHLQLRSVNLLNDKVIVEESEQPANADPSKGHIESIVALTSVGEHVVSSGRDGRVILWKVQEDEDGLPTAQFVQKLEQYDSIPTSLYWNATTNILYIACTNGTLEIVKAMNKKTQAKKASERTAKGIAKKTTDATSVLVSSTSNGKSVAEKGKASRSKITFDDDLDDSDDEVTAKSSKKTVPSEFCTKQASKSESIMDSDDEEKSDKENDAVGSPNKSSSKLPPLTPKDGDLAMEDDSDHDLAGPETQAPPVRDTAATTEMDSDDNFPSSKSPAKDKSNNDTKNDEVEDEDISKTDPKLANGSPSKSMESDDEFSLKSPSSKEGKETASRLSKQSTATHDDSDDDDDIFEEADDTTTEKDQQQKLAAKNVFIEDEAEDAKEDDDDEDAMVDEAATEKAAGVSTSNETPSNTHVSPTQNNDGQGEQGTNDDTVDGTGNNNGVQNFDNDDSDDENSMANDLEEFNKNYQQGRAAGSGSFGGVVLPEPQAAFAPSSTPLDLQRRYLCWNSVGSVTLLRREDTGRTSVDINFTDSAFRRPITLTDNVEYIMGSLGDDGGIFATDLAHDEDDDLDDDDDVMEGLSLSAQTKANLKKSQKQRMRKGAAGRRPTGSRILFHRYASFVRDKDWVLELPDGERVLGCASGLGWAAAITSRKFLRLFTSGGAQGQIIWLPGNPVTIVGRNRFLAVFYHESMPLQDGTQCLGYMLYDAVAHRTITKGYVACISAGSSLSWAGFSNDCSLMAMDSDGMLSMLIATAMTGNVEDDSAQPTSWEWAPMLDTIGLRKSSDDGFWPVTIYDGKLVYIPLKGGTQYPEAGRRPITATVGMKMPLARSTLAKSSALEELSVRSNIALVQKQVNNEISSGELLGEQFEEEEYHTLCKQVDKVTLKLFDATVEAGKLERALNLVDRLHLEKSYDIAMAMATRHDKLVDLVEEAKENRFGAADEGDEVDEGDDYDTRDSDSQYDQRTSPPKSRPHSSQRISPETGHAFKSKRSFAEPSNWQGRNVRSKA